VVLFGALHCRDVPGWMLHRVSREDERVAAAGVHGAVLLARYQEPAAQVLFYLLEEIGIAHRILTIPDIARFPRQIQLWIPPLADALAGYHGAILFDEKALGLASPRAGGDGHD
jgi:hypothetical protein